MRIPRIDHASTDLQPLPCVIIQVISKGQRIYRIQSKHGVLRTCSHASNLEPFAGTYSIPTSGWQNEKKITLREAARLQSPWNTFTKNRCKCKPGTCNSRRCHCKKTAIECSTHCHKGEACCNKPCKRKREVKMETPRGKYNLIFMYCITLLMDNNN